MFDMYVIDLALQFCLKSGSSDWMACMCAVDLDSFLCLLVVVVGGRSNCQVVGSLTSFVDAWDFLCVLISVFCD